MSPVAEANPSAQWGDLARGARSITPDTNKGDLTTALWVNQR